MPLSCLVACSAAAGVEVFIASGAGMDEDAGEDLRLGTGLVGGHGSAGILTTSLT